MNKKLNNNIETFMEDLDEIITDIEESLEIDLDDMYDLDDVYDLDDLDE